MLVIYKSTLEGKMEMQANITHNSWLHLVKPTANEIDYVVEELAIPRDFIIDSLDHEERPRIEQRDGAIMMVIHIPFDREDIESSRQDVKYRTIPMGIIHTKDHMLTICGEEVPFLVDFFNSEMNDSATHMKTRNTLNILNTTARAYIHSSATIEREIGWAEAELAKSYRNREMYTLLNLNESLIYMVTSLKQMKFTMKKILHGDYIKRYEADADVLDDVLIELEQAYEVTEINQANLNNVMDAYGNMIQNNVNQVLKLLAAFTIILSVPMLIASIYGMNVPIPFQDKPNAFLFVIVVTSL
ncbi:magnesium transporter CorA family protein [Bacillus sp. Bva_UNVM-123]|uniref:magnesium transporter CorA family protein n=1 Tax=Bacillus sp. Bva_UNVM-123 TaxID=2829798 RepID=UPI00391F5A21